MKILGAKFQTIDWPRIDPTTHAGESGTATWRTVEMGNVRVRMVEYSRGYVADHWCDRGHVVHVLEGELVTELRDGTTVTLLAGDTYVVAEAEDAHRSRAPAGARLFIVD